MLLLTGCASTVNQDGSETPGFGYRLLHKTRIWKFINEDG